MKKYILSIYFFLSLTSFSIVKAQSYILETDHVMFEQLIKSCNDSDSLLFVTINIKNKSTKRIFVPYMEVVPIELHYLNISNRVYFYNGIKYNILGKMNLGMSIRLEELLPNSIITRSFFVKLKTSIRQIQEIVCMFEYLPNYKLRKYLKDHNGVIIVDGNYYWENCKNIYLTTPIRLY